MFVEINLTSERIEGYLAYFDLQGFSDLISKAQFDDEFDTFHGIIEDSIRKSENEVYYRFFSDSVVIFTKEISSEKFVSITEILSEISYNLATNLGLTVSGGLSCGIFSLHEHKESVIFAGKPMVDAVHIEQTQNWFGITISPSVMEKEKMLHTLISVPFDGDKIDELNARLVYPQILYYIQQFGNIPIKFQGGNGDETISGFIIIPQPSTPNNPSEADKNLIEFAHELNILKYRVSNPYVQLKYNRTIDIINRMEVRWYLITQSKKTIHDKAIIKMKNLSL